MSHNAHYIEADVDVKKLSPIQDMLLVKVLDRDKTSGGILLPKNEATPCRVGKVLSRGKAIPNNYNGEDFPIRVDPGEYVMFMDYAGEKLKVSWKDYKLIREHGLWAKVELSASGDIVDFEKIEPWAERIVLERRDETMTKSGNLYLPNSDLKLAWNIGTVKWVGFGVWHVSSGKLLPCESKPGDRVLFKRYSGADILVRGREYRITQELDVIAIIEGKGDAEWLRPLRGKVVVEREKSADRTPAGLIIPEKSKEKLRRGKVVSLGAPLLFADGSDRPWGIHLKERILFKEAQGQEVQHNGKEYVIVGNEDILGGIDD